MSMVADRLSVAASRKCTLWAVLAVTIRLGPPGRLLRSSITPPRWSLPGVIRQSSFSQEDGCAGQEGVYVRPYPVEDGRKRPLGRAIPAHNDRKITPP